MTAIFIFKSHRNNTFKNKFLPDDSAEEGVETEIFSFEHLEKSGSLLDRVVRLHLSLLLKLTSDLILLQITIMNYEAG